MVSVSQKRWEPGFQTGGPGMVQVKQRRNKNATKGDRSYYHGSVSGYFRAMVMLWRYFWLSYSRVRPKNGLAFSVAVAVLFMKRWQTSAGLVQVFASAGAR